MRQVIATPAGPLQFECRVGDLELLQTQTREVARGVIEEWVSPGVVDITFVRVDLDPPLFGSGPSVDALAAVVWTITANQLAGPITCEARLVGAEVQRYINPDNGEALESVTYERAGLSLSIGTQDDEALAARVSRRAATRAGPPLPAAWAPALVVPWQGDYGARSSPTGITVSLPPLPAGEQADLHIAVAWAAGRDDPVTWFAVDTDPGQILEAALGRSD